MTGIDTSHFFLINLNDSYRYHNSKQFRKMRRYHNSKQFRKMRRYHNSKQFRKMRRLVMILCALKSTYETIYTDKLESLQKSRFDNASAFYAGG